MSPKNERKCIYSNCMIPENNNRYWAQLAFLFLALLILTINQEQFTLTAIMVFIVPEMIDLIYCQIDNKACHVMRWIFGIYNAFIIIVCFAGFAGALVDKGTYFEISSMYITGTISKQLCGWFLAADILIPVMYAISSPCLKQLETHKKAEQQLSHSKG